MDQKSHNKKRMLSPAEEAELSKTAKTGDDELAALFARFVNLEVVDQTALVATYKNAGANDLIRLSNLALTLPANMAKESIKKVLDKVINLSKSSLAAVWGTGDPSPLDFYHSGEDTAIYLPENLDESFDHPLVVAMLDLTTRYSFIDIKYTKGDILITKENSYNAFLLGVIQELVSTDPIEAIPKPDLNNYSSMGRIWARYRIVQKVLTSDLIPEKYRKEIPPSILYELAHVGRGIRAKLEKTRIDLVERAVLATKLKEKTDQRRYSTLVEGLITAFLKGDRVTYQSRVRAYAFTDGAGAVFARLKRTTTDRDGKTRTVEPKRPSEIASLFKWERLAVAELFQFRWKGTDDLIKMVNAKIKEKLADCKGQKLEWSEFENLIRNHINAQWDVSGIIEKHTAARFDFLSGVTIVGGNRIEALRSFLNNYDTMAKAYESKLDHNLIDPRIMWGSQAFTWRTAVNSTNSVLVNDLYNDTTRVTLIPELAKLFNLWSTLRTTNEGTKSSRETPKSVEIRKPPSRGLPALASRGGRR